MPGFAHKGTDSIKGIRSEEKQALLCNILDTLNRSEGWENSIKHILKLLKDFSGCNAAGIRLESDEDYPYYAQEGFSEEFLNLENFLCARNNDGSRQLDSNGKPVLECTCGMILAGKADPQKPYMTERGSLWTNHSVDFLNAPPEEELRLNPRNTCIHFGYLSVLLIPLKIDNKIAGILQLNYRRAGSLDPEEISFYEGIGDTISIAYKRIMNETDLKRSKLLTEESVNIARTLLNASDKIILMIDATDNTVLEINERGAKYLGYDQHTIIGKKIKDVLPRESAAVLSEHIIKATKSQVEIRYQEEHHHRHYLNQVVPVESENGMIKRCAVFIQDISELKQIKELRESNAAKDQLLSIIAHDLKNPVSSILNLSDLICRNIHQNDINKTITLLQSVHQTAGSTLVLLDNLLTWLRKQKGLIDFRPQYLKILPLIEEVIVILDSAALLKKITIRISLSEHDTVYADFEMLKTIIRNLLQNGIKFTRPGGIVEISSTNTVSGTEIKISDNGVGMLEEALAALFSDEKNISTTGTSKEKGTGLGLTICKNFVETHGGRLNIESRYGHGCTVTIFFPSPPECP